MAAFRRTASTQQWSGRYLRVDREELEVEGDTFVREIVRHPGSVAVVPYHQGKVVLLRQYRPAVDSWVYEIPAGKRDVPGEDPAETARRECVEEVGLRPGRLTLLHRFYNSPGYTDEETHLYLAEDLTPEPASPQGQEEVHAEVVEVSLDEAIATVTGGGIVDAKTVLGLYSVLQRMT